MLVIEPPGIGSIHDRAKHTPLVMTQPIAIETTPFSRRVNSK
jgi:hypothetical protein